MRDLCLAWCRIEGKEIVLHEFVDLHDCGLVATPVAIVRSGEDSDNVAFVGPVVPVHNKLVGSCNSGEVVGVVELL